MRTCGGIILWYVELSCAASRGHKSWMVCSCWWMGTQQSNWWMKKGKRASLSWRERRHAEEAETAACLEGIRLAAGWPHFFSDGWLGEHVWFEAILGWITSFYFNSPWEDHFLSWFEEMYYQISWSINGKGLFPQPYNYWGLVGFGFVVKRNERKLSVVHTRNAISPLALYDIVY